MSKGQRNKTGETSSYDSSYFMDSHENKNKDRKALIKKVAAIAATVAILIFLVGMSIFNILTDRGFFVRNAIAASSENYEINIPTMTYFFRTNYMNFVTQNQSYLSAFGLDTTKSLKSQTFTGSTTGETWFDFLIEQTKSSLTEYLALCESARDRGLELDDKDYEEIDKSIESFKSQAEEQKYSLNEYLTNQYGIGVRESDVRHALEISALASKCAQALTDEADLSDENLESEYAANKTSYDKIDYITYTLDYNNIMPKDEAEDTSADENSDTEEANDDAAKAEAIGKIATSAAELEACTNAEDFKAWIKNYEISVLGSEEAEASETAENAYVRKGSYTSGDEKSEWAISAAAGEIKSFPVNDGEKITVMLIVTPARRDEDKTRNVRHILFTNGTYEDDTKVNEVYDKWVSDGASLEDFEALVTEYSEDPGSSSNGGLYENVVEGQMVTEFDSWLFDAARVEGDHAIVETSYGWHIMYYVGETDTPMWKSKVSDTLKNEYYDEKVTELKESKTVTFNDKDISNIVA